MTVSPNPVPKSRTPPAKPAVATPERARWIMFMPTIPAKPASVRVRIWRRLQAIGAVNLRGAVYVLPNREDCIELFEWLSRELVGLGGQASLCEGRFIDATTDDDIQTRFVDARNADYEEVADAAKQLATQLKAKRIAADRVTAIAEQHAKLAHRFSEIVAIDFVDAPGRIPAEEQLAIVAIIHDLDLLDGKFGREEAAGVRSAIDGICTVARDDEARIAAASPMLDGLYSHFTLQTRRKPRKAR